MQRLVSKVFTGAKLEEELNLFLGTIPAENFHSLNVQNDKTIVLYKQKQPLPQNLKAHLAAEEKRILFESLLQSKGDVSLGAEQLNLHEIEYRTKLREHDIPFSVRTKSKRIIKVAGKSPPPAIPNFTMSETPRRPRFSNFFPIDLMQSLKQIEAQLIKEALRHSKGNQTQAAKLLTLKRSSFQYKLKSYGIKTKDYN